MRIQEDPSLARPIRARGRRSVAEWLGDLPMFTRILLGVATVAVVAGGVMSFILGGASSSLSVNVDPAIADTALAAGVAEGNTLSPAPATEDTSRGDFWVGVSYLAGFCSGVFLRAVVKSTLITASFWLLMTMILSYAEMVSVDWNAINDLWSRFILMVEREWGNLESFVLGSLAAICAAIAGVATGIKRH